MNKPLLLSLGAATLALSAVLIPQLAADDGEQALLARAQGNFKPLSSPAVPGDAAARARIDLGAQLFFETRVSTDGKQSCGECHQPQHYGTDALPRSVGNAGRLIPRNAPTVFNTSMQFVQHYGGNRADVEEQALKALISPLAYGNKDYAAAETRLRAIGGYRPLFEKAFPGEAEPVTAKNWSVAIGAYERTLITPSDFDRYLQGDVKALNAQAKRGLAKFIDTGCSGCHSGALLGGTMYQKFGITADYWTQTGSPEIDLFKGRDKGRFQDTKDEADAFMFKVQQLRNVAVTPPYFHDGSVAKLGDAVRIMGRLQLGAELSDADVADIVAFLQSLTGQVPASFATVPVLPAAAYGG